VLLPLRRRLSQRRAATTVALVLGENVEPQLNDGHPAYVHIRAAMDYAIARLSFRYAPTKLPCLAASNCGVIATFQKF